jgi:hypothetical protein
MTDLKVSFKLSSSDLERLDEFLAKASAVASERSEAAIVPSSIRTT